MLLSLFYSVYSFQIFNKNLHAAVEDYFQIELSEKIPSYRKHFYITNIFLNEKKYPGVYFSLEQDLESIEKRNLYIKRTCIKIKTFPEYEFTIPIDNLNILYCRTPSIKLTGTLVGILQSETLEITPKRKLQMLKSKFYWEFIFHKGLVIKSFNAVFYELKNAYKCNFTIYNRILLFFKNNNDLLFSFFKRLNETEINKCSTFIKFLINTIDLYDETDTLNHLTKDISILISNYDSNRKTILLCWLLIDLYNLYNVVNNKNEKFEIFEITRPKIPSPIKKIKLIKIALNEFKDSDISNIEVYKGNNESLEFYKSQIHDGNIFIFIEEKIIQNYNLQTIFVQFEVSDQLERRTIDL